MRSDHIKILEADHGLCASCGASSLVKGGVDFKLQMATDKSVTDFWATFHIRFSVDLEQELKFCPGCAAQVLDNFKLALQQKKPFDYLTMWYPGEVIR